MCAFVFARVYVFVYACMMHHTSRSHVTYIKTLFTLSVGLLRYPPQDNKRIGLTKNMKREDVEQAFQVMNWEGYGTLS